MNYIREINAFERRMRRFPLSATTQLLWYKLMHLSNTLHWPEWFAVDNIRLMSMISVNGVKTLRVARKELLDAGLIVFEKGVKGRPSRYKLLSVEAMQLAQRGTESASLEGIKIFPGEVEDITQYFGYTEALGQELRRITRQLYEAYFANGNPTSQDERRVFFYIKSQSRQENGEWIMSFPQEKKELLAYAFEQASLAGNVNWNYIEGIYRNFRRRGIANVEQAYEYELERDRCKGRL